MTLTRGQVSAIVISKGRVMGKCPVPCPGGMCSESSPSLRPIPWRVTSHSPRQPMTSSGAAKHPGLMPVCTPSIIHCFFGPYESPPIQHLDQSRCFCGACCRDQQSDRQTTERATSVATGDIYAKHPGRADLLDACFTHAN